MIYHLDSQQQLTYSDILPELVLGMIVWQTLTGTSPPWNWSVWVRVNLAPGQQVDWPANTDWTLDLIKARSTIVKVLSDPSGVIGSRHINRVVVRSVTSRLRPITRLQVASTVLASSNLLSLKADKAVYASECTVVDDNWPRCRDVLSRDTIRSV